MTLRAPHAVLALLIKEWNSLPTEERLTPEPGTHHVIGENLRFLAARGVVVLDAWIAALTDEQVNDLVRSTMELDADEPVYRREREALRDALRAVAEATSGATGRREATT